MLRFAKVATPATAPTDVEPLRVPPGDAVAFHGFLPSESEMVLVRFVRLPKRSTIFTTTFAPNELFASTVAGGCVVNLSSEAAPGVTLNAALVPAPSPDVVAESL